MMHIKRNDTDDPLGGFESWCGVQVGGFTRAYLSIDNALKAIEARRGIYPCHQCLAEIHRAISDALPKETS